MDSPDQVKIYERDEEHSKIKEFLRNGINKGQSGLMYLCGHPGTGKTSSLNLVLAQLRQDRSSTRVDFKPLLFNAMTYPDVKSFMIVLHEQIHEEYYGVEPKKALKRNDDVEDMAYIIEKLLVKITDE